ncbi:latent-transforming growth factor beta-binding protein 4-like isoform X1 [Argiope bruennichi]|uniref:latent-transforming growth factor beta-binding protein 4-like isoform X1 n=1 Tax=Argiope bruennichi TaxID=94029 RepID=UPI0024946A22|nr:latent-transforming growth factor beta-binding protein 4-like isoform X1 [Argiope bruennichi]
MESQLLKTFLLLSFLRSAVPATLNFLSDSEIRNHINQEWNKSKNSSCEESQCAPGHCINVLGRDICLWPEGINRSHSGKDVEKRCSLLCWPRKRFVKKGKEVCLCPEGFVFSRGFCKRVRVKCQRSLSCFPGECSIVKEKEVCLCPPGYFSEHGFCKEATNVCSHFDCKPGQCMKEFGEEKCLCPAGYTAKDDKCVEISLHVPGKLTTVMLMVIVSAASVILTTLFGVGICYYFSQRG